MQEILRLDQALTLENETSFNRGNFKCCGRSVEEAISALIQMR